MALLVRASYLLELRDSPFLSVLMVDARQYDEWAQDIASGNWIGQETFYQAPFYPYMLAVVYRLFGHDTWMVRVVQLLIGSSCCVLVAVAGRCFFSSGAGIAAGFLLALYAPAVFFGGLIQKAILGLFFMALLLVLTGRLLTTMRWWTLILCGIVLGCFSLTRENALILVPIIMFWLLVHFRDKPLPLRIRSCVLVAIGLGAILLPVGLRNRIVGGEFLLTTSQLGPNFYIGNNIDADGRTAPMRPRRDDPRYERQDSIEIAEEALGRELTPSEVSDYWMDRSLDYIRANPRHWMGLLVKKWFLLWNRTEIMDAEAIEAYQRYSVLLRGLGAVFHFGVLLPAAALGAWLARRRIGALWLLYAMGIAVALSVTIFFVNARYRVPLIPILVLFAGSGLHGLFRRGTGRRVKEVLPGVALGAVVAAVSNLPNTPQADPVAITYANVGTALAARDRPEEALRFYKEAIELIPELEAAHFGAGRVAADQGRLEEAEEHYKKAIELRPDYVAAHDELGIVLRAQGRVPEAIRHFERAIELYPRYQSAHNNLGNAYVQLGRYEDAIRCYEDALAIDPDQPLAHLNLGSVLDAMGRAKDARRHLERALELDPSRSVAHFLLGRLLARAGDNAEALGHLQAAARLNPADAGVQNALGLVLAALGRLDEAKLALEKALEIEPDYPVARKNLDRVMEAARRSRTR